MTTNVKVFPVDGPAVLYFQDGSSTTIDAQTEKQFQIISNGFVTISDTPAEMDAESGEHPPPGYAFAKAMVDFWQGMVAQLEQPEVNPL